MVQVPCGTSRALAGHFGNKMEGMPPNTQQKTLYYTLAVQILVPSRTTGFRKSDLSTHLMCLYPRGYTTRHGRSREITGYTAVPLGLNTHYRCACTPGGTMFNTGSWSLYPGIALTTVLHVNPVSACPIGHVSL
jgi:hypothetical protein